MDDERFDGLRELRFDLFHRPSPVHVAVEDARLGQAHARGGDGGRREAGQRLQQQLSPGVGCRV